MSRTLAEGLAVDAKALEWVAKEPKTLPSGGPNAIGDFGEPPGEVSSGTGEMVT